MTTKELITRLTKLDYQFKRSRWSRTVWYCEHKDSRTVTPYAQFGKTSPTFIVVCGNVPHIDCDSGKHTLETLYREVVKKELGL
jgi:hypothetical protein